VDYVLCEDTRVTGKLLHAHDVKNKLVRYDAHSSPTAAAKVLKDLEAGANIALVSDAGTPGVSDPGVLLVEAAREAAVPVVAVPGASAVTAAVSIAGLHGNQFMFLGFIPQKKGRDTFFKTLISYSVPVVCFESTHRILKTLAALGNVLPDTPITLARELTKLHEECVVATPSELLTQLTDDPQRQRGEFVLIISKER
jgi:16S rRNA (cytidine1402-2'-O)-methyltransferase